MEDQGREKAQRSAGTEDRGLSVETKSEQPSEKAMSIYLELAVVREPAETQRQAEM